MRLLDAKTLELVDVRDDAVPPYAILSHTWGNEEITLQELRHMKRRMPQSLDKRKRTIADKEGFVKVKCAASLAVTGGYSFIWVDTCCIDKSSSAELSEAINSMYLWYQQAEECYAFLSDVESAKEETWSMPNSSFRRSRWFTRGWTLQELIAPKAVHFYARDWSLLGHKDGPNAFMEIISKVTGIDGEVLDGRIDPLQLSISARMKWASHRHTSRLEDTAYSLMGLFQVNMPLLYGEGHRAFTRLQEEIIQRSDDQSLYAWNSFGNAEEDPDALYGLLAHSPAQFKDAGNIQPLPPSPVYASAPSGMTNHGLRVQLYLRPILEADGVPMEEDYDAILDCLIPVGDLYQCPVIRLRRLSEDQYARLQARSRKLSPPQQVEFPEHEGYRIIFVRQQPVYYHLPQFRISPLHIHSNLHSQHFELTEIFPPCQWNSTTMTMRVKYSRKLQAMGIFRFQPPIPPGEKVDVVVGLRRLDAMQWEGWCFQRSCRGSSLESTLSMINQKVAELTRRKNSIISSGMLRDSLGDDSHLMTDATVEGMQLQGRLYISISMSLKPKIETAKYIYELCASSTQRGPIFPTKQSRMRIPLLHHFQIRTLTGPCSQSYVTNSVLFNHVESSRGLSAVRGMPSPASGITASVDHFMKPLREFLEHVRGQKQKAELESSAELPDELALALFEGDNTEVKRLLNMGVDLDSHTSDVYGFGPLHWAVAGGSVESIRILLQNGVSPLSVTQEGWTACHVSALFCRSVWNAISAYGVSDEQLQELANKRTKGYLETPLHLSAAYCSNSEYGLSFFRGLSKNILTYGCLFARNKYDETPLHRAAAFNNDGVIRSIVSLCNQSNYIDVVDRYGRSPLWHAAATGSCDAAKVLISLNASINLTDDMGRSPLLAACRGGHHKAVEMLLHEGARQSTKTSILSLTALDYAAMFGHVRCLQHLLNLRSPMHALLPTEPTMVAAQNKALHIAASCGWLKCVDVLCSVGADPFKATNHYLKLNNSKRYAVVVEEEGDALSAAAKEGHLEIVRYFDTADTCKEGRLRKQFGDDGPTGSAPVYNSDLPLDSATEAEDHHGRPIADIEDSAHSVQQLPPNAKVPSHGHLHSIFPFLGRAKGRSSAEQSSAGNSSTAPNGYTPANQYYRNSSSAPFMAPGPSKPGSHSATLPAYSSAAYSQFSSGSRYGYSYQPSQPTLNPHLANNQTPSARPETIAPGHSYSSPHRTLSATHSQS